MLEQLNGYRSFSVLLPETIKPYNNFSNLSMRRPRKIVIFCYSEDREHCNKKLAHCEALPVYLSGLGISVLAAGSGVNGMVAVVRT